MEHDSVLVEEEDMQDSLVAMMPPAEGVSPAEGGSEADTAHPMQGLLEDADYGMNLPARGEIRQGTIARISPTEVLVDIGAKSEGVISGRELERIDESTRNRFQVGQDILVYVVSPEDKNGNILLSYTRAQEEQDWRDAERLRDSQEVYSGTVAGFNKGGLLIKIGKVRGFMPASQLGPGRRKGQNETPEERWGHLVGQPIQVKVIEVDRARNRLILSERAAARENRERQKEQLLASIKEGDVRTGRVISLADFGAFVDLGGADGLIHLSELSHKRVNHPKELLKVGQEVQVQVLSVDRDRRRIALSMKRLEEDPWTRIQRKYKQGQLVEAMITKLAKFGAFARIQGEDSVEGLIHISELSDGRVAHPKEVVKEGQTVTLRVIRVDPERKRIGLSLKKVDSPAYADLDWRQAMKEADEGVPPMPDRAEARAAQRRAKSRSRPREEFEYDDELEEGELEEFDEFDEDEEDDN
jgi:small subunit ribosomal protein S1